MQVVIKIIQRGGIVSKLQKRTGASPPGQITHISGLSCRQIEILLLLIEGKMNKEIAAVLGISPKTVEFHLANLYAKLNVRTRIEAVVWALQHEIRS
jgi:DNA-binding NarL/FixJ family response regulator